MINKFYVGVSRSLKPNVITKLQMWLYDINYSHSYIRFEHYGTHIIFHSTGAYGAHMTTFAKFKKDRQPVKEVMVPTDSSPLSMLEYCLESKKTYGTKQMLGAGIAKVFRMHHNPFSDKDEEHCSMTAGRFIEKFSSLDIPGDPSLWAPKDIIDFFNSQNMKVQSL